MIPDPDVVLHKMLVESIEICEEWADKGALSGRGVDDDAWTAVCRLTVAAEER
jgi:hypothetical protein